MKLSNLVSPNIRDAWRILRNKPLKYTLDKNAVTRYVAFSHLTPEDYRLLALINREEDDEIATDPDDSGLAIGMIVGEKDMVLTNVIAGIISGAMPRQVEKANSSSSLDSSRTSKVVQVFQYESNLFERMEKEFLANKIRVVVFNMEFLAKDLTRAIEILVEHGVETVIGWGYDAFSTEVVDILNGYPNLVVTNNLWKLDLGVNSQAITKSSLTQNEDLVSIIIPAYNCRDLIEESLADVAKQTHKNWELIVAEDASPDSIADIIDRFRASVPQNRVEFVRKEINSGASATRNVALKIAKGKYVAFLDADDRWLPNHISRKIRLLEQKDADLVFSSVVIFDSSTGQSLYTFGPDAQAIRHFPESLFVGPMVQPSALVIRMSVLDDIGLFDESVTMVEDFDFCLRAVRNKKRFFYDPKITTRYRKNHSDALTTGREVLCHDRLARVAMRNGDLISDPNLRNRLLSRLVAMAGYGHLGHKPNARNKCNEQEGLQLIRAATQLDKDNPDSLKWLQFAEFVGKNRLVPFFRKSFRKQFQKFSATVSLDELKKAG